ncbi:MAG TPA: hypothetical protein VEW03_03215, partial [Longimicrobiaceae bacterium]|nr:hypothetical protein [Longimicrobiaceae bacterium]
MISPQELARDGHRLRRAYREWLSGVRHGVDQALARRDGVRGDALRAAAGLGGGLADRREGEVDAAGPHGADGQKDRRG